MPRNGYKFIHTSDWHLGAPIDWGPEKKDGPWLSLFRHYREKTVESIVKQAIKNGVNSVLVAGDVIDIYSCGYLTPEIQDFLTNRVVAPLKSNDIKLFLTVGSHDPKSEESKNVLLSLKTLFPKHVEVLVPERYESAFQSRLVKNSIIDNGLTISCNKPDGSRRWIEFKHDSKSSTISYNNPPLYRAFGDRHALTYQANGAFFPGTPFARSSASDNQFTDAEPRYCLLYNSEEVSPKPIRLKVPEVAILRKMNSEDKWEFFYERDPIRNSWSDTPPYQGPIRDTLRRIMDAFPGVCFVTLVIKSQEEGLFSVKVYQELVSFVKDAKKIISGSREGIMTVMIREPREL